MNDQEREAIALRRERGESISKIAKALGLNSNTVSRSARDKISVQNDDTVYVAAVRHCPSIKGKAEAFVQMSAVIVLEQMGEVYQKNISARLAVWPLKARSNRKYCSRFMLTTASGYSI